ncbi:hypothetical protein RMN56_12810 [Micromonospora halotolerans]|uniref:Apea-like HEPN domain-containing protein n=1 Tax=Micromonospora halotolerans TaxID=709879 RepID=A0ABZ0A3K6_9ACTN|nr:hypothetical protein [Micromonospora halotolerans]WNM42151.1 hypothetical protein RMN56_12810 [Micromonospora halotolerans]
MEQTAGVPLPGLLHNIKHRAQGPGFKVKTNGDGTHLTVQIPATGGGHRQVLIDRDNAQFFLDAEFEYWTFIGEYVAVHHASRGEIEVVLLPPSPIEIRRLNTLGGVERGVLNRLFGSRALHANFNLEFEPNPKSSLRLRIAATSHALMSTMGLTSRAALTNGIARLPSLYISGLSNKDLAGEKVIASVAEIVDAVFVEFDMNYGIKLEPRRFPGQGEARAADSFDPTSLPRIPRLRYSHEATTLYRYAASASGMPLLSFLAYYQVIEHSFPSYAERETLRRLRHIVVDPTFNPHRDADLARLSLAIKGKSFQSEREQLKSTLHYCVTAEDLRSFIESDELRQNFLGARKGLNGIPQIALKDDKQPLQDQVAARIYEIRCRIVHSKDGGGPNDAPLLLPFSTEARQLTHDIDLIRFLAQKVLIAGADKSTWI